MARNERRRVKKLEKKRTERKTEHVQAARIKSASSAVRMAAASSWPVIAALETTPDGGITSCVIARRGSNGLTAVSNFLIDRYCLGVKDAWSKLATADEYASILEKYEDIGVTEVSAAHLRKLVEDSVAYARSLGLEPHDDYAAAALLFGDINATECTDEFEFGFNGKPLFIQGPYDSPAFCQRVMTSIKRVDRDSKYLVRLDSADFDDEDFDDVEDELDDEIDDSEILFDEPDDVIEVSGGPAKA